MGVNGTFLRYLRHPIVCARQLYCKKCKDKNFLIECKCGCDEIRALIGARGEPVMYINGHYGRRNLRKGSVGGEGHPSWKGGRFVTQAGYVLVKAEGHLRASSNHGYVFEHILVYERYHSCCLLPRAVIHHINGNKQDNRPENLELMSNSGHTTHHNPHPGRWLHCLWCGVLRYAAPHDIRQRTRACSRSCNTKLTALLNRSRFRQTPYRGFVHRLRDARGRWVRL